MPKRDPELLSRLYPVDSIFYACNDPKKHRHRRLLLKVVGHTAAGIKLTNGYYSSWEQRFFGYIHPKTEIAYSFARGFLIRLPGSILVPFTAGPAERCDHPHWRPAYQCYTYLSPRWKNVQVLRKCLCYIRLALDCSTPILEAIFYTWPLKWSFEQ